ncbi:MAG: type II toxin-antitoxin system VapC family toxin [Acidimicrobiales bacterium]
MARRRQPRQLRVAPGPEAVVLDSGALSAAAEGDTRVRAELSVAEQLGASVHVSSVTLTEVLRGHARDALVHALLAGVEQNSVTPELGRAAGELLGRTHRDDTVDAIIAATAHGLAVTVRLLTGDPDDLRALTSEMPTVTVVPL